MQTPQVGPRAYAWQDSTEYTPLMAGLPALLPVPAVRFSTLEYFVEGITLTGIKD